MAPVSLAWPKLGCKKQTVYASINVRASPPNRLRETPRNREGTAMTGNNRAILILLAAMALSLAILMLFVPVIPQSQSYHAFADQRTLLGIPNFWNVVSNIPFIAIGAIGLRRFRDDPATIILFLGFLLTGIGSSYYHWD